MRENNILSNNNFYLIIIFIVVFVLLDDDAVSPLIIPFEIQKRFSNFNVSLDIMENTGHFLMMEDPHQWAKLILKVLKKEE